MAYDEIDTSWFLKAEACWSNEKPSFSSTSIFQSFVVLPGWMKLVTKRWQLVIPKYPSSELSMKNPCSDLSMTLWVPKKVKQMERLEVQIQMATASTPDATRWTAARSFCGQWWKVRRECRWDELMESSKMWRAPPQFLQLRQINRHRNFCSWNRIPEAPFFSFNMFFRPQEMALTFFQQHIKSFSWLAQLMTSSWASKPWSELIDLVAQSQQQVQAENETIGSTLWDVKTVGFWELFSGSGKADGLAASRGQDGGTKELGRSLLEQTLRAV